MEATPPPYGLLAFIWPQCLALQTQLYVQYNVLQSHNKVDESNTSVE